MTTTTIVYRQEIMSSPSYRNVKTVTTTVKIMGDTKDGGEGSPRTRRSTSRSKKKQRIEVDLVPASYQPGAFTIIAYLPQDGDGVEKRMKLHCSPGQTVKQVIDSGIPSISKAGYQVFQYPARALLNPQKEASILRDQEIWIEPVQPRIDEVDDQRLAVVKELLRTEDSYLENLRNVFDIYMDPLKKWGLNDDDIHALFGSLSKLCDRLMVFFSTLEVAVKSWNTDTTTIGGLFQRYPDFWDMYEEYGQNYDHACSLLKVKRKADEAFNKFLEVKRGAAMHTLESLMLLPVQRITDYHRLLRHLLEITSKNHPDYDSLRCTVATVAAMVQARKQQLNLSQNDIKLEQVQLRFPNEHLCLTDPLEEASPMEYKSRSSKGSGFSPVPKAPRVKSAPFITMEPAGSPKKQHRLYLQEGPAKMFDEGFQSHNRYLFLFDDLLIVAKPSGRNRSQQRAAYKLKHRLRLSEMWIARCGKELNANSLHSPDTSMIIGWPITNCTAVFSSAQEKELWETQLDKHILQQRQTIQPPEVSIRIADYSRTNGAPVWLQVQSTEQASTVLKKAADKFLINDVQNCQLWVSSSREEGDSLLLGFECPFAIQTYHNRQQRNPLTMDAKPVQILFMVKRKPLSTGDDRPNSNMSSSSSQGRSGKTSRLVEWYRSKKRQSSTESGSSKKKPRVFGAPLGLVIVAKQLPAILEEMFVRLYTEGPSTLGIFRQSANYRKVKELREVIDNGESVDLSEVSIHTVAALLKELLRNVPGGILQSSRYTEFVATNDTKDVPTRIQQIQKVLKRLPEENQEFLRYLLPLLHFITTHSAVNCMNSVNLAICFAPTLLWPDSGLDVIKNEVPPLVQFLVEHSIEIFHDDVPDMYKQFQYQGDSHCNIEIEVSSQGVNFIPTKTDDGTDLSQNRNNSVDTTTSEDSGEDGEDDDEDEPHPNLMATKTSGLTYSDSQLSHISETGRDENIVVTSGHTGTVCLSGKDIKNIKVQSPSPPPTMRVPKAPERSNSYHSPTERPRRYKKSNGEYPRRRSTNQHKNSSRHPGSYASDLPSVQSSPPSSSSSQGSPRVRQHRRRKSDDSISLSSQLGLPEPTKKNILPLKARTRSPHHSNSFNKSPAMRHEKPIPTSSSASFYDSLLPLDSPVESQRVRSRSHGNTHLVNLRKEAEPLSVKWPSSSVEAAPPASSLTHESMHSLVSSRSGSSSSSYPFHDPYAHSSVRPGGGGGMPRIPSSDPLEDLGKTPVSQMNKDMIKEAISHRFGIVSSMDWRHGAPADMAPLLKSNPTSQVPGSQQQQQEPSKTRSVPGETSSIDEVGKKLHERKWLTATAETTVGKSRSYQNFAGTKPSVQETSPDDRPESEQHLHSLPRTADGKHPVPITVQVATSGYNSDTESSPSRTLIRQKEKLQEVTSPVLPPPAVRLGVPSRHGYQQQRAETRPKPADEILRCSTSPSFTVVGHPTKSPDLSKETPGLVKLQPCNVSLPQAVEAASARGTGVTSEKRDSLQGKEGGDSFVRVDSTKNSEGSKNCVSRADSMNKDVAKRDSLKAEQIKTDPRSGQIFSKEKTKMVGDRSSVTDASRDQPVSSPPSVEDDKSKVVQRQRSRSITDNDKVVATTNKSVLRADEDKGRRYQDMINGAPTPSERKAWTQQQSLRQSSEKETKVRSLRHNPVESSKQDSSRSSTLPEPLSTNCTATIPTFKVVTFEIPGPKQIRKINLRTPQIYC